MVLRRQTRSVKWVKPGVLFSKRGAVSYSIMNEPERAELAQLKEQQAQLEREVGQLSAQLKLLEQRLSVAAPPKAVAPAASQLGASPAPNRPTAAPVAEVARQTAAREPFPVQPAQALPPPLPPIVPPPRVTPSLGSQAPRMSPVQGAPEVRRPSIGAAAAPPISKPAESRSFEMRLGTYWAPRIGIVVLLTGLVFFGNLAYEQYISRLGPAGKVLLLYCASALLLGAGWWWQRKAAKESLKNYAQVLFAGGLASLYFTTYAAHHIEQLRVIQSPLLDGFLLLACAAFIVFHADRRKSELLALLAIGLAYYTSIITRVGSFTLYSNLVLTAAAVFFLVRNRWAVVSYGSLVASYAAYAFWRFYDGSAWHWASPAEGLWSGTCFLVCYWAVFSAGVFLSRDEKFAGENRSGFLTLNNGAFFTMFLLTMLQVRQGGFWEFSLIYGTVLLALSELALRVLPREPLARNAYLTQGLLLVTLGFISKFAGLNLALILATESFVLLSLGQQRRSLVLLTGGYIAAALGAGWGIDGMQQFDREGLYLGMGLGALLLADALLMHRRTAEKPFLLRAQVSFFTVLALAVWLVTTWDNSSHAHFPLVLAVESVLLTFSIYLLGAPEIALLSQSFLVLAQTAWVLNSLESSPRWWEPALLIAVSLGMSHWWQKQKILSCNSNARGFWEGLYALGIVAILYLWVHRLVTPPDWMLLASLLAIGITAYGVATRAWFLAAAAQLFVLFSGAQFIEEFWQTKAPWSLALAPLATLVVLSLATVRWFQQRPQADARVRGPLLQIALVYRWAALVMALIWVFQYIPEREWMWVLVLTGFVVFLCAGRLRTPEAALFGAVFTLTGLIVFWLPQNSEPAGVYWPNLLAILAVLAQQQIAKRRPQDYPFDSQIHMAAILLGSLSLWLFLTRWVLEKAGGFYLTASWSALALVLFVCGMVLRERVYRWLGLAVLGCALGRIVIFDVWKLESLYRILSFMALGIVLLVLGFVYSKYQEKLREWL